MKRRGGGALMPDLSDLRDLLNDGKAHALLGVVTKTSSDQHWRKVTGKGGRTDILVEVETAPLAYDLTCRLTSTAGGPGMGLWRVPAVGVEVLVVVPDGEIDFMPTIAAVYSSGSVPERAGPDRTVLVAPDAIEVQAPKVTVGPDAASSTQGVVVENNSVKLGGSAATEPLVKGTARNTPEQIYLTAMVTAFQAIGGALTSLGQTSAGTAATVTAVAAINLFAGALPGTLSTVSKTR